MNSDDSKYYKAYEDRYRQVYSQGIESWTNDPEELDRTIKHLDAFLQYYALEPSNVSIVEFGCGEGYIGKHLIQKGYAYKGIDISQSALKKARKRLDENSYPSLDSHFIFGDATDLAEISSKSFDAMVDNFCLQMLVTDSDRKKYLSEAHRLLKAGGCACFYKILQAEQFEKVIFSFEDFVSRFSFDLKTCEERYAYSQNGRKKINLPRLPARFNNEEGYRQELSGIGFHVEKLSSDGHYVAIYARKSD